MNTKETPKVQIYIAPKNIFILLGVILTIWLAFALRDVIILIFIAIIVACALGPMARIVHAKLKLNYELSLLSMYLLLLAIISLLGYIILTPLVIQAQNFVSQVPRYVTGALVNSGVVPSYTQASSVTDQLWQVFANQSASGNDQPAIVSQVISFFSGRVNDVAQGAFDATIGLFTLTLSFIFILVFSFYLLLERKELENTVANNLPFLKERQKNDVIQIVSGIEDKLGRWARGQAILCLTIGTITYIGLLALGVEYALPLAVLAGLLEFVPIIGPIISAVPAILVMLATGSWQNAILVALLYILIQQLENNLVVPMIMKKAVGFSPIISILAILIGGTLMGIPGALLAVPVCASVYVIMEHYAKKQPAHE